MNKSRKYGLLETDINKIISIFKANQKIKKVVLFGSRAIGTFYPGSDIDIALEGENLNLNDILSSKIEIEKLSLPYKFDIIIYERIKEELLIEHINRVGIILFDRRNIAHRINAKT